MAKQRLVTDSDLLSLKSHFAYDPQDGKMSWAVSKPHVSMGMRAGTLNKVTGYLTVYLNGRRWSYARVAWMLHHNSLIPEAHEVDHLDGNPLNNSASNLRAVPKQINMQNRTRPHKQGTSGFLGVSWNKSERKWYAQLQHQRKHVHVGIFDTPEAAHQAYIEAKRRLHPGCTI